MNVNFKRLLSFLLAVILVVSLPVGVMATTEDTGTDKSAVDTTPKTEESNSSTDTIGPESDSEIMTTATTTKDLFFWNLSNPNYTVKLSSQLEVRYQISGDDAVQTAWIKVLGWHYSTDANHPLYCLEPSKDYGESTSYNVVDEGVALYGSADTYGMSVWFSLPEDIRYSIGLILLHSEAMWDYSYDVKTTAKADNPNVTLRVATQFLLWEVITGLRDVDSFVRRESNGYTKGDIFYNAGVKDISDFASVYDLLVSRIEGELIIPSFTGLDSDNAPVIRLSGGAATAIDHNGVLSEFLFSEGEGVCFSTSGNELTITQTGTISSSEVFCCKRELPSPITSTYSIWYSPYIPDYQTCITLHEADYSSVEAYFRLEPAYGELKIRKNTEDGSNLEGWIFSVFSDDACTLLVSGPHVSDSSGEIVIPDLLEGTVYVKELGHTDPLIQELYECVSTNPQAASIASGQTAEVIFTNRLKPAEISIQKVDTSGNPLAGAVFLLEWSVDGAKWLPVSSTDSPYVTEGACTSEGLLDGCLTSPMDGVVRFTGLHPGRYYRLTEVSVPDGYQLLTGAAFEGTIPVDEGLTVTLTVVNAPVYELPMTGSKSFAVMAVSLCICIAGCIGALVYLRRKEQ